MYENESESLSALNIAKKAIYNNLKECPFHIQGCLIAEDGRHLKLDGELITIWARAIVRFIFILLTYLLINIYL